MLAGFCEQFNLDINLALGVAGAFGGGIAHRGDICGVISGGIIVIGLKYGKRKADDNKSRDYAYQLVDEFITEFTARHKTMLCRELLGYDISIPEHYKIIMSQGLPGKKCPTFIRDASEIIQSLIE